MSGAPERIWARDDGAFIMAFDYQECGATEYVRADLHAAAIARAERAEAEVQRLRNAIAAKGGTEHAPTQDAYDAACRAIEKHRERAGRAEAALAAAEKALREISDNSYNLWEASVARTALAKIAALKGGE